MSSQIKYGLQWPEDHSPLAIEFDFIRAGGYIVHGDRRFGEGLLAHFLNARRLVWPHRYEHRWTRLIYEQIINNTITILMGAASCVAGRTKILDPITRLETPIEELCRNRVRPLVMTLAGPRLAEIPFWKGCVELFEVTLDNGAKFTASANHRALTGRAFERLSSFYVGQPLLAYAEYPPKSTGGISPSVPIEDVWRWWKTTPDFRCDCLMDFHSYDARLLPAATASQDVAPSRADARTHRECVSPPLDGWAPEYVCSPWGPPSFRPSRHSDPFRPYNKGISSICRAPSKTTPHASGWSEWHEQSQTATTPDLPSEGLISSSCYSSTVYEMPCREYRVQRALITSIKSVGVQDYYDVEVPGVHHYFAEGAIHHNTQKTSHAAEWVLLDYWCFPDNTLALLTTTNTDKLETNVFGEIKSLWGYGKDKFPWLAGHVVDHKHSIFTDDIDAVTVRDRRRGIIGKACYEGKQWVGDAVFVGIKQDRVRFIGDELQWMAGTFLRSWNPLFSNPDLKVIGSGNPNHNPDDPLGIAAEPKEGWSSLPEPQKTEIWPTRFLDGVCVNLVGTDSPNFDAPEDAPEPFPRLIGRKFYKRIVHDSGPDSPDFYRLVKGVMKFSLAHDRVITRQLCRDHHAHDKAEWADTKRIKIYAVDPAYGGGDRCMSGYIEFGNDRHGRQILRFTSPKEIRINLSLATSPEDQIAAAVARDLEQHEIPPENAFYGAFGKGTIGFAFARQFGAHSPVPIEEGGNPSKRPVRQDLRIFDEVKREFRHKRCDEHYSKRITELWFSWRYAIEAEQVRELPEDVMEEGCTRQYSTVAGNKIEVESKDDMKERLSRSPDKADWAAFCVEGARQRGFVINMLGPAEEDSEDENWLRDKMDKHLELVRSKRIVVTG